MKKAVALVLILSLLAAPARAMQVDLTGMSPADLAALIKAAEYELQEDPAEYFAWKLYRELYTTAAFPEARASDTRTDGAPGKSLTWVFDDSLSLAANYKDESSPYADEFHFLYIDRSGRTDFYGLETSAIQNAIAFCTLAPGSNISIFTGSQDIWDGLLSNKAQLGPATYVYGYDISSYWLTVTTKAGDDYASVFCTLTSK